MINHSDAILRTTGAANDDGINGSTVVITVGGCKSLGSLMSFEDIVTKLDPKGSGQISTKGLEALMKDTSTHDEIALYGNLIQANEPTSESANEKGTKNSWWSWHAELYRLQHGKDAK